MNQKAILLSMTSAILLMGTVIAHAANIGTTLYGVYSETFAGMKFDTKNPSDSDGAYMGAWNASLKSITASPAEGDASLKVTVYAYSTNGGVYMQFGYPSPTQVPTDMSAYKGGRLDFMIKTEYEVGVKVTFKNNSGKVVGVEKFVHGDFDVPLDNKWHHVSVPLSSFSSDTITLNYATVVQPAVFFAKYTDPAPSFDRVFYIDNVFWRKSSVGTFSATLFNISDNKKATSVSWDKSKVKLGQTGWLRANQYIKLDLNSYYEGWGIQIYTNNTASNAVPKYTGSGSAAGLVDTTNTKKALPMCWRIVDVTTNTYTIQQGANGYPDRLWSKELGSSYPCFFWMMDRSDDKFSDGADYVTVWDNGGIHHAEGSSNRGGAVSPNYIYLGAKFSNAVTPRTYKTGKLTIEFFHE